MADVGETTGARPGKPGNADDDDEELGPSSVDAEVCDNPGLFDAIDAVSYTHLRAHET